MRNINVFVLVLLATLALPALAAVSDDAIKMAQNGIQDDVIVAWCEAQQIASITAQDVLRMKEGKVPDRAIIAMIRNAAANRPVAVATKPLPVENTTTEYVETPSTTYVSPPPYYYVDRYPYYYGYPYYGSPYYGYWGPTFGFGFRFGGGHGGGHGGGSHHH